MIKTKTPEQWIEENVDIDKLTKKIYSALGEAVRFNNVEDEFYVAHVHDVVNGNNGQYVPYFALEYFGYEMNNQEYDLDTVVWELETFSTDIAELINGRINSPVKVVFGVWESDGSYSLLAILNKNHYEDNKELFGFE